MYNILCDSVGLIPEPNNGTLRLPLRPVGTHKSEDTPAEPEDPVPPYTTTASQTTASAHPTAAHSSTPEKSIQVDPVPQPSSTEAPTEDKQGGDDGEESQGAEEDAIQKGKAAMIGIWDWLTDKFGKVWDKISGSKGDKESEEKEGSE